MSSSCSRLSLGALLGSGRDRCGGAGLEFALVVPMIALVLVGIVEVGIMLLAQGVLESAAWRASRAASAGYAPEGAGRESYIREFVAEQGMGLLRPDNIAVSATVHPSFAEIGRAGKGAPGLDGPQDVVVYELSYPWRGLTPMLRRIFGDVTLTATLTARNEPS